MTQNDFLFFDRATRRRGICRFSSRTAGKSQTIGLSQWIFDAHLIETAPEAPEEPVLNTLVRARVARKYTQDLLRHFGLSHWGFTFDRATRRMGICRYSARVAAKSQTIGLSQWIFDANPLRGDVCPWDAVIDTVRHEVAHAVAGREAGHGPAWKRIHLAMGGSGEAVCSRADVLRSVQPTAAQRLGPKWLGECPNGCHSWKRARLSGRVRFSSRCPKCGCGIQWKNLR